MLPELPALALERDEHHRHKDVYEHTLTVLEQAIDLEHRLRRRARLRVAVRRADARRRQAATRRFVDDGTVTFHHHDVVGAKLTRKRMQALRFSNDEIDAVAKLVELHLRFHGYGAGEWTDSAVRRYVRDAGDQLERLHILTRADCTTRNQRKADRLRRTYDDLEERIARLSEQEELASMRPDLDGNQIMEILGIPPGPVVGRGLPLPARAADGRGPAVQRRGARAAACVAVVADKPEPRSARVIPTPVAIVTVRSLPGMTRSSRCSKSPSRSPPRPRSVWSLVTDLPRMAPWSPQVVQTVVRGGPVELGTRS